MGYYSDKYPQCSEAYEFDRQIEQNKEQAEYERYILNRKENHEKELVERLANSIDKFSISMVKLAEAIKTQQPPMVVNITGLDESNVEKLSTIFHI